VLPQIFDVLDVLSGIDGPLNKQELGFVMFANDGKNHQCLRELLSLGVR
jgi:hypothetical protein